MNVRKENGCTPLHDAAILGSKEVVCELINHGAVKSVVAGKYGTPLHQAVIKGHVETVKAMLEDENGSVLTNHNVEFTREAVQCDLYVMLAVLYGQVEMCKLLISKGGVVSDKDRYSLSPFERCFVGGLAYN